MAKEAVTPSEKSKEILYSLTNRDFIQQVSSLIKCHSNLVYISSTEEERILEFFKHYSIAGGYECIVWDCYKGFCKFRNDDRDFEVINELKTPEEALDYIIKEEFDEHSNNYKKVKGVLWILLDFHRWLDDCTPPLERRLRNYCKVNRSSTIIMTGPTYESTPALDKEIRFFDFPYPNSEEIKKILYNVTKSVAGMVPSVLELVKNQEEEIISASTGLTHSELNDAYAKSLCMHRNVEISAILNEKQEIIKKTGMLEFSQPNLTLDDIGGLEPLIEFLKERKVCFSKEARDFGIPASKGVMMCGCPGAGKSLCAKAIASYYEIPLLRLDFGALFGQYVGESEGRLRQVLKIVEAVSPCVLFIDEVEKGLAGAKSSGTTDSGVTARVIGSLLTWMQEKDKSVFLAFTANNVEGIPAEFMRAGRLDAVFFLDLPTSYERVLISEKLLKRKKRNPENFNLQAISAKSEGYTGAEIEKAIDNGLLLAFNDNKRELTTEDIIISLGKIKSLKSMRPELIESLQIWAKDKCIRANSDAKVQSKFKDEQKKINVDNNDL